MATRIYFTSDAYTGPLTSAGWISEWEGSFGGVTLRHRKGWADVVGAPARPNSANDEVLIKTGGNGATGEYYGARVYFGPLKGGTSVSASQAMEGGLMGRHDSTWGFHWMTMGAQIVDKDGNQQKDLTLLAPWTDGIYANNNSYQPNSLESRYDTGTTRTGSYTTVDNDWLLVELGCHIETTSSMNLYFQFGDGNGSDITSTDSGTNRNPFFEMATTFELLRGNQRLVLPHMNMIGIEAT